MKCSFQWVLVVFHLVECDLAKTFEALQANKIVEQT